MKNLLLSLLLVLFAAPAMADQYVPGHYRDGKWVNGYWRSSPNSTTDDNFGSYPNTNPYTGEQGRKKPDDGWKPIKPIGPASGLNDDGGSSSYNPYKPAKPSGCQQQPASGFGVLPTLKTDPPNPYATRC